GEIVRQLVCVDVKIREGAGAAPHVESASRVGAHAELRIVRDVDEHVDAQVSLRRSKVAWNELTAVGLSVYVSPIVMVCERSRLPGDPVVKAFLPSNNDWAR